MRKPQRFGVGKSVGKALVLMDRKAHGKFRRGAESIRGGKLVTGDRWTIVQGLLETRLRGSELGGCVIGAFLRSVGLESMLEAFGWIFPKGET